MSSTPLLKLVIREPTDECPEEHGSHTLSEKIRCSQDREKVLTAKTKELEERIAELLPLENTLKKREHEVEMLESKSKELGQQVLMLKKEQEKVKMELMSEEKNKIELKAHYEKKISDIEGKWTALQKLYDGEKVTDRPVEQYNIQADELLRSQTETKNLQNEVKKLQQEVEQQTEKATAQKMTADQLKDELTLKVKEYSKSRVKLEKQASSGQSNAQKKKKETEKVTCQSPGCVALQKREECEQKKLAETTEKRTLHLQSLVTALKKKMSDQESLCMTAVAEKDAISGQLAKAQENIKLDNKTIKKQSDSLRKLEKGLQTMTTELAKLKMENSLVKKLERAQKEPGTSKNTQLAREASSGKKPLLNDTKLEIKKSNERDINTPLQKARLSWVGGVKLNREPLPNLDEESADLSALTYSDSVSLSSEV